MSGVKGTKGLNLHRLLGQCWPLKLRARGASATVSQNELPLRLRCTDHRVACVSGDMGMLNLAHWLRCNIQRLCRLNPVRSRHAWWALNLLTVSITGVQVLLQPHSERF